MEPSPAPGDRRLMDGCTFTDNFGELRLHKTYLCYEVQVLEGDSWIPVDKFKDFLRNKGSDTLGPRRHAELCFLDRILSWDLDKEKHYRITCFISWSPCPDCALELAKFLAENSHVSLCIFAARIYDIFKGYDDGLRRLQAAGAQVAIMTSKELKHCWETFVDHQGRPFQPWDNLDENSHKLSKRLEGILKNEGN